MGGWGVLGGGGGGVGETYEEVRMMFGGRRWRECGRGGLERREARV